MLRTVFCIVLFFSLVSCARNPSSFVPPSDLAEKIKSSMEGAIIFINSTQGVLMWPGLVDLLDEDEQFQNVFHDVIAKFFPELEEHE